MLYAAGDQVNAVVPFGIAGLTNTTLNVPDPSGIPASLSLPVASSSPGIFTLSGSGVGQGAILNQDSTLNSVDNPAARGSIIVFFATGAGQTDPPGTDGLIPSTVLSDATSPGFGPDRRRYSGDSVRRCCARTDFRRSASELSGAYADLARECDFPPAHRR